MNRKIILVLGAIDAINDQGGTANRTTIAAVVERAAQAAGMAIALSLLLDVIDYIEEQAMRRGESAGQFAKQVLTMYHRAEGNIK